MRLENFDFFPGGFQFGVDFVFGSPLPPFFKLFFFFTGILSLILFSPHPWPSSVLNDIFAFFCPLHSRSLSSLPAWGLRVGCGVEEKPQAQNSIYSSWIPEGGVGEEGGIPSPPALRKNGALKALALIPSPFSLPPGLGHF